MPRDEASFSRCFAHDTGSCPLRRNPAKLEFAAHGVPRANRTNLRPCGMFCWGSNRVFKIVCKKLLVKFVSGDQFSKFAA